MRRNACALCVGLCTLVAGCNNTDNPRPNRGEAVGPGTTSGGLGDRNITADNRDTMPPDQRPTPSGDTNSSGPGTAPGPMTPPQNKGPLTPPNQTVTPTPQTVPQRNPATPQEPPR